MFDFNKAMYVFRFIQNGHIFGYIENESESI